MLFYPQYDWLVSYEVMLTAAIGYLTSVFVLYQIMGFLDKQNPKMLLVVYNAAQVLLCGYMVWGFGQSSFSLANVFGLNNQFNADTEWFMLVHYLSKFLDFCDTWFMLVRKSHDQLTFLHVYHHTSILLIWGFLLHVNEGNGTAYFGAAINSVIHMIMYGHYLYTALGFKNPFKEFITIAQLAQFGLCILHAILAVLFENVLDRKLAYLQVAYHITMIILFRNFFISAYGGKKKNKADKDNKSDSAHSSSSNNNSNGVAINGKDNTHVGDKSPTMRSTRSRKAE